jgi:hypothetical protein
VRQTSAADKARPIAADIAHTVATPRREVRRRRAKAEAGSAGRRRLNAPARRTAAATRRGQEGANSTHCSVFAFSNTSSIAPTM